MDHGKNVRSPSLEQGSTYVMKTWGKTPVFSTVTFDGFVSGGHLFKQPNKQLKDMIAGDYYKLVSDAVSFKGRMLENCLVHDASESRITFFYPAGVSAPAKPAKLPKTAKTTVPAAPPTPPPAPVETAAERKKRLDRERKAQKREDARAAKAAAEAAAQTAPEQTESEPEQTGADDVVEDIKETTGVEASDDGEETSGIDTSVEHVPTTVDEQPAATA